MSESLNVIALVSGGKDSFYSLLHCIQNGHKVVALGNLYPAPTVFPDQGAEDNDEHDLNSFMYQTVGHTVIPLYEQALGIPLYRQQIIGTAVQTELSYGHAAEDPGIQKDEKLGCGAEQDETESLVPLLKRIMAAHPTANALSTGAILSTYQRTRIESVALRLGLVPLAYLWQYPILPPATQSSLLSDMQDVGLDARIVKVASGGLDEDFLWANVADPVVIHRINKSMKRFGMDGDGAALGEGGEFETLVIDGPVSLFKGRIEVREEARRVVREGGGSAWLRILDASVVMKESMKTEVICRVPALLEPRFESILATIPVIDNGNSCDKDTVVPEPALHELAQTMSLAPDNIYCHEGVQEAEEGILHWTVKEEASIDQTISQEAAKLVEQIRLLLHQISSQPTAIISTLIILRSMTDFANVNKVS
jgi:diphthine-ammonia ligase